MAEESESNPVESVETPLVEVAEAAEEDEATAQPTEDTDSETVTLIGAEIAQVVSSLTQLQESVVALTQQVERYQDRANAQDQLIRDMDQRIQELQRNQVRALLTPIFTNLQKLHADANNFGNHASDPMIKEDFLTFAEMIEDILDDYGLQSVEAAAGDEFVPSKHRAQKRLATPDSELDGRIARVLRQGFGFVDSDRIALPALVNVYRYEEVAPPAKQEIPTGQDTESTPDSDMEQTQTPAASEQL